MERFNSLEQMFDRIHSRAKAAYAAASDEQRSITWGDNYVMFYDEFPIFGHIFTKEENRQSCLAAGGTEAEADYEQENLERTFGEGYRFGRAYSVAVTDGELGSNHISGMHKISPEQFEAAKSYNWVHEDIFQNCDWYIQLVFEAL